jgi:hypothetical protein
MEIDEHLKYTLYVIPPNFHFMDKSLTYFLACNSIHARVRVSQWCQGGRLTTFCNKSSLKYDALQCPRLVEDRLELIKPILKEPFVHLKSQNKEYLEFHYSSWNLVHLVSMCLSPYYALIVMAVEKDLLMNR